MQNFPSCWSPSLAPTDSGLRPKLLANGSQGPGSSSYWPHLWPRSALPSSTLCAPAFLSHFLCLGLSSHWNFTCSFLSSLLLAMADHFAGPISSFFPLSMCLQWAPCGLSSQLWSWPDDLLWPIACASVGCFSGRCRRGESTSDQGPYLVEVRISECAREYSFYNSKKRWGPFLFY